MTRKTPQSTHKTRSEPTASSNNKQNQNIAQHKIDKKDNIKK